MELLSPVGNFEKLDAALHFGADAVYLAGNKYGLRAAADNFDEAGLKAAVDKVHSCGKKVYVTLNIYARDTDIDGMPEYIKYLDSIGVDAVIVSDLGVFSLVRRLAPDMAIHVSTQASVTNSEAANFFARLGAKRIVLARELNLDEIKRIRDSLPQEVELEAFVHGAMCISYSGRCLLSDFMTGRRANGGECAQSCRWEYAVAEKTRGEYLPIDEDARGTYIFNSKDMNMIRHIADLDRAGIYSLKIEGRVKSSYYVGSVTNAYRCAINLYKCGRGQNLPSNVIDSLIKTSHRDFTTGFYFGETDKQFYESAKPVCEYDFVGIVVDKVEDDIIVEMRGRFKTGDELEALSSGEDDNESFIVDEMKDENGQAVTDAKIVQQRLRMHTRLKLSVGDMLRKRRVK